MSSRTLLLAGSASVVLVATLVVGNLIVSCRGPLTPSKPAVRSGHGVGEVDARAGDWPSWRGRLGDGISRETGWTIEGRPDDLWRVSVGRGYSNVSVAAGRLFTLGYDLDTEEDVLWCLDALTGEVLWSKQWKADIWDRAHRGGTLTTPIVDGERLYVSNREGRLYCLDVVGGDEYWYHDQYDEIPGLDRYSWGFAASPLLHDDLVVMNLGKVVAYDKQTGEQRWITKSGFGSAYSTPTRFELRGETIFAVFGGKGLAVVRASDGAELGFHGFHHSTEVNAASPVVMGAQVFISSGYNRGCAMIDVAGREPEIVWESRVLRTKMAGVTLFEDHFYGFDEAIFKCVDLGGHEVWRKRGLGSGAHVVADGKLVLLTSDGDLVIAEASPDGWKELCRREVFSEGKLWTTPVLANGLLYLRNSEGDLVCRDHRPVVDGG